MWADQEDPGHQRKNNIDAESGEPLGQVLAAMRTAFSV